ncbi:hypothetical protein LEP1GSC072_1751 [Leptospira noguchii str. Bonito]|nr:hypothetical protein LEP1GSC072_1751 [Leptospira noguchii str. Bonito]
MFKADLILFKKSFCFITICSKAAPGSISLIFLMKYNSVLGHAVK